MRLELTLPALERLLGGDTEVEAHLRQQIVEEFAKKHLKAILNDETWKRVSALWRADLDRAVTARLDELINEKAAVADRPDAPYEARWRLNEAIRKAAQAAVDAEVARVIENQKRYFATEINRAVKVAMEREVNKEVEAEIQRRLTAAKEAK